MTNGIKIDTREFDRAMQEYMRVTSKTTTEAINQKAYSINIAATALTFKKNASAIEATLKETVTAANGKTAPRFALLINAARKLKGMRGLYGAEMEAEAERFIKSRRSHGAFLASGWLPAVAIFAAAIGKAVGKSAARRLEKFGKKIGGGAPAVDRGRRFDLAATFFNEAGAETTNNASGAESMAGAGLQAAINQEASRIDEYIAKKLQQDSNKFFGKLLR